MSREQAESALTEVLEYVARQGESLETIQLMATVASTFATFELADKQHTSNLIAYASHRLEHPNAVQTKSAVLGNILGRADFQIREALDLHPDPELVTTS